MILTNYSFLDFLNENMKRLLRSPFRKSLHIDSIRCLPSLKVDFKANALKLVINEKLLA